MRNLKYHFFFTNEAYSYVTICFNCGLFIILANKLCFGDKKKRQNDRVLHMALSLLTAFLFIIVTKKTTYIYDNR